jgi:hypothetical protein
MEEVKKDASRPVNNIRESDLLVNQPRNINVHEGSNYVKRFRQRNNSNIRYTNVKEVIIFKGNEA